MLWSFHSSDICLNTKVYWSCASPKCQMFKYSHHCWLAFEFSSLFTRPKGPCMFQHCACWAMYNYIKAILNSAALDLGSIFSTVQNISILFTMLNRVPTEHFMDASSLPQHGSSLPGWLRSAVGQQPRCCPMLLWSWSQCMKSNDVNFSVNKP